MDNRDQEYDMLFKVLIIGDSGVGKSNLLIRFVKNEYSDNLKSTIGAEFSSKLITIDQNVVKAQIWDTAGQERYRSITNSYYKGAKGVLIIFDLTNIVTFNNVNRWVDEFKMKSDSNSVIILVGNKNDLTENRQVTREMGELKAKELALAYFETSAKDNINVELAFTVLIEKIVSKYQVYIAEGEGDNVEEGIKISPNNDTIIEDCEEDAENKKKGCCLR